MSDPTIPDANSLKGFLTALFGEQGNKVVAVCGLLTATLSGITGGLVLAKTLVDEWLRWSFWTLLLAVCVSALFFGRRRTQINVPGNEPFYLPVRKGGFVWGAILALVALPSDIGFTLWASYYPVSLKGPQVSVCGISLTVNKRDADWIIKPELLLIGVTHKNPKEEFGDIVAFNPISFLIQKKAFVKQAVIDDFEVIVDRYEPLPEFSHDMAGGVMPADQVDVLVELRPTAGSTCHPSYVVDTENRLVPWRHLTIKDDFVSFVSLHVFSKVPGFYWVRANMHVSSGLGSSRTIPLLPEARCVLFIGESPHAAVAGLASTKLPTVNDPAITIAPDGFSYSALPVALEPSKKPISALPAPPSPLPKAQDHEPRKPLSTPSNSPTLPRPKQEPPKA